MDLSDLPAIDHHAHNVFRPECAPDFAAAFTEASDPELVDRHVRNSLCFRRSLGDLARLLGCDPREEAILLRRGELGIEALTRLCLKSARLEVILLDDGFQPDRSFPIAWHEQFLPVRRVLRLESLAEELAAAAGEWDEFRDRCRAALEAPPDNVAAFKSIAAYRSGLAIEAFPEAEARRAYASWRQRGGRLRDKVLVDSLLHEALAIAGRRRLPVQLHTGFGDPDLDLRLANPLHLRPVLEQYPDTPFVLLHASYPFAREAGYLAAVHANVWVDLGLAVPLLSMEGMRRAAGMLLELAPASKLMYSSDAHVIPELFWLAAWRGRRVLGEVLGRSVVDGELTEAEAQDLAGRILHGTAHDLYRLG